MFQFSLQVFSEAFIIRERNEQDVVFTLSTRYSCPILLKLEFS